MTTVRLLHGLGADRRAFQRFARLLPAEWDVAALDLLGHGDAPHPAHGYALDDGAAWIESQVADAAPVHLVGHSYGAATSVAVAARHPELVTSLVLLDPVVDLDPGRAGSRTGEMIEARRAGTLEATVHELYPDASPALQAWTIQTWQRMALGVADELDPEWTRFADRVTCPVTIIHGEPEFGGSGDLSADWFDESRVVAITGAGHYLHATHAREVAAAVV
ncbi:MAG: hypothetical protein JWM98_2415, partial [Thermoleophilia bacterium]|nr:hypothetical protein [Thermoleophilia bacterium]